MSQKGFKLDEGKPKLLEVFTLLDWDFLKDCSEVMKKGKEKYGFENWKKDLESERIKNALIRHLKLYFDGQEIDSESGKSHLCHIMCNAMFLHYYDKNSCFDNLVKNLK